MVDITGSRFGRWTVIGNPVLGYGRSYKWECKCDCGTVRYVAGSRLRNCESKSCGCLKKDSARSHGMSKSRVYCVWLAMKRRCFAVDDKSYKNYGGRGVTVCTRWLQFENFLADMGVPQFGLQLDRIDNDGDYEPENCRWTTRKQNMRNTRANRLLTIGAETKCLTAWAEQYGISFCTVCDRLRRGWTVEEAITAQVSASSVYRGVSWHTRDCAWRAQITANGRKKMLGNFKSEYEAALAYNKAAKKIHGDRAYQNTVGEGLE